jgi:hypothetical protein
MERNDHSREAIEMKIQYDPSLLDEVVLREIRQREEKGDLRPLKEYHALVDPIYEKKLLPPVREAEFEKIHRKFFIDFGFEKLIVDSLLEFPELEAIEEVFVKKAMGDREEWADLGLGRKRIGIRIRQVHFDDTQNFLRYLRHEFRHVADMVDESFGHPRSEEGFPSDSSPSEIALLRDRYNTIWDIYVDGRLNRQGKETIVDQEGHFRLFEAIYRGVPLVQLNAAFEALWGIEKLTHAEILEMAKDPGKVLERGETGWQSRGKQRRAFFPGSLCPLCRFPTFHWADDLDKLPKEAMESLKKDFPTWEPEEGACNQCIETYRVEAGIW